jgi:hypothetical protein
MSKKKHSFTDTNGRRWVACVECERGHFGSEKNKCSGAWRYKRFNGAGCFLGTEINQETNSSGEKK